MNETSSYRLTLVPLAQLRASEATDPVTVDTLVARIVGDGAWTSVLPIEAGSGFVMDGNHRLAAAHRLGLECLPCVRLDYGDARLNVTRWGNGAPISTRELDDIVRSGQLLPCKETRHVFVPPLPGLSMPLALLLPAGSDDEAGFRLAGKHFARGPTRLGSIPKLQ